MELYCSLILGFDVACTGSVSYTHLDVYKRQVVDITNHTLLEMGQPMHAFDLNKVAGRTIDVRRAHEGEKIVTLDEKEFTLNPNNLVICDTEKPVALAGIMGGANSGMDENTTSLLFECATFARDSVRKTSRALGQNSDCLLYTSFHSSKRRRPLPFSMENQV